MELERAWSGRAFDSLEDRKFPSSSYAARRLPSSISSDAGKGRTPLWRKIAVPTTQATCRPTNAINSAPLSDKGDRVASVSSCSSSKNLPVAAKARTKSNFNAFRGWGISDRGKKKKKLCEESFIVNYLVNSFSFLSELFEEVFRYWYYTIENETYFQFQKLKTFLYDLKSLSIFLE